MKIFFSFSPFVRFLGMERDTYFQDNRNDSFEARRQRRVTIFFSFSSSLKVYTTIHLSKVSNSLDECLVNFFPHVSRIFTRTMTY